MPKKQEQQPQEFLMRTDAAQIIGVSTKQVQRLTNRGVLPIMGKTPLGYNLYRREDVAQFAEERRQIPPKRGPEPGRPRKASTQKTKTRKVKNTEG